MEADLPAPKAEPDAPRAVRPDMPPRAAAIKPSQPTPRVITGVYYKSIPQPDGGLEIWLHTTPPDAPAGSPHGIEVAHLRAEDIVLAQEQLIAFGPSTARLSFRVPHWRIQGTHEDINLTGETHGMTVLGRVPAQTFSETLALAAEKAVSTLLDQPDTRRAEEDYREAVLHDPNLRQRAISRASNASLVSVACEESAVRHIASLRRGTLVETAVTD